MTKITDPEVRDMGIRAASSSAKSIKYPSSNIIYSINFFSAIFLVTISCSFLSSCSNLLLISYVS